jgi:hypothetical protein
MSMPQIIWQKVPLEPLPLLAELRERVLTRNAKRCPKWGFRLTPDLVIQLQPRPVMAPARAAVEQGCVQVIHRFAGQLALEPGGAPAAVFRTKYRPAPGTWRVKFQIEATEETGWTLKLCSFRCLIADNPLRHILGIRNRLLEGLSPRYWQELSADRMLTPQCLVCGRSLTDPASMARFIGPECAGSSSLAVHTYRLAAVE